MEMEYFCREGEDEDLHRYWIDFSMDWYRGLGLRGKKLRVREHSAEELPHYSKASADVEFEFPWGWGELETISNRTDYDLKAHASRAGKDLTYYDNDRNERYVPFVVEPAMGADRSALAFWPTRTIQRARAKTSGSSCDSIRTLAPFEVAVLPLSRNPKLTPCADAFMMSCRPGFRTQYDDTQSIGRRYRRQDEIGTALCVTVDFDTVESDDAVTIRNRDTMAQVRVQIDALHGAVNESTLNNAQGVPGMIRRSAAPVICPRSIRIDQCS